MKQRKIGPGLVAFQEMEKKTWADLTDPKDVLDLALEICEIKRLLYIATDPLEIKELLHRRPRTSKNDDRSFPDASLFLKILVAIRAELAKIGQTILAFRDADI